MVKTISHVRYMMDMGCNRDVWRIYGITSGGNIMPSTPLECNEKDQTFTTGNSIYLILSYDMNKEEFWRQIKEDIDNKGYEVH